MSVRPSVVRPSVCLSVRPSVCPSVRLSVRPFFRSSVRPFVRPSICPSVRSSVCPSVRPSSVRPSVRPSVVRPSVCPSVRPSFVRPSVWCQHFQNPNALRPLGRRRWNVARVFYGCGDKTSRKENFEFRPLCFGGEVTLPDRSMLNLFVSYKFYKAFNIALIFCSTDASLWRISRFNGRP